MNFANQDIFSREDLDTNPVLVSLSYDDARRTVTARTLGRHMLVGVRKWSVSFQREGSICIVKVSTHSADKARNFRNWLGAKTEAGRSAQGNIWVEYLNNVVKPHRDSCRFISGDSSATLDIHETIDFNPYLP